jgi:hypothetical protein
MIRCTTQSPTDNQNEEIIDSLKYEIASLKALMGSGHMKYLILHVMVSILFLKKSQ